MNLSLILFQGHSLCLIARLHVMTVPAWRSRSQASKSSISTTNSRGTNSAGSISHILPTSSWSLSTDFLAALEVLVQTHTTDVAHAGQRISSPPGHVHPCSRHAKPSVTPVASPAPALPTFGNETLHSMSSPCPPDIIPTPLPSPPDIVDLTLLEEVCDQLIGPDTGDLIEQSPGDMPAEDDLALNAAPLQGDLALNAVTFQGCTSQSWAVHSTSQDNVMQPNLLRLNSPSFSERHMVNRPTDDMLSQANSQAKTESHSKSERSGKKRGGQAIFPRLSPGDSG